VRFTEESLEGSNRKRVSHDSAIGPIALFPDEAQAVEAAQELPAACADFGILREGHSWYQDAGSVPAGSKLGRVNTAGVITDVRLEAESAEEGDMSTDNQVLSIRVTVKPYGVGDFEGHADVQLVSAQGAQQSLTVRAHGKVMSVDIGTPVTKDGVHCVDPA
jgi:hypothetical protein